LTNSAQKKTPCDRPVLKAQKPGYTELSTIGATGFEPATPTTPILR
jgi:hypothetical protein